MAGTNQLCQRRATNRVQRGVAIVGLALVLISGSASAGPKAYVGNFADNSVSVIDVDAGKVIATIPVATGPHGIAISSDGSKVYVSGDGSTAVDVIDAATDRVAKTLQVGKAPNGVTLTRDGKILLVAVYGEDKVTFVDTSTDAISGTIEVAKPHTISIAPDGKSAYVTSQEPGHFALAVLDLDARKVAQIIALEKTPRDGEFSPDGKAFYFTEAGISAVEVLDPANGKIIAEIPTGVSPHYVNLFSGMNSGLVVVQGPGELVLFDPKTNHPERSIAVGKQPHWAAVSADRKTAFVTNEGSNDLSIVDLGSGKVISVAVGHAPRKVVVQTMDRQHAATGEPHVSIAGFAFNPGTLTVSPGETVTWSNDDGSPHRIAFRDGTSGSDALSPGDSFSRTFNKLGAFDYYCSFHPYMTARILVAASQ